MLPVTQVNEKFIYDDLSSENFDLKTYEREAKKNRDVKKAVSLTLFYWSKNTHWDNQVATIWLLKAKKYLKVTDIDLGQLIDLKNFLSKFNSIEWIKFFYPFNQEIVDVISNSPSITQLNLSPFTNYTEELTASIGKFLSSSAYIEKVSLSSVPPWLGVTLRLNSKTVEPIASALKINSSIKELDLSDTLIGEDGAAKIIDAIRKNPHSKIEVLNFFCCGLTDRNAKKLIKLLNEKTHIRWINTRYNNLLSGFYVEKFKEIFEKK